MKTVTQKIFLAICNLGWFSTYLFWVLRYYIKPREKMSLVGVEIAAPDQEAFWIEAQQMGIDRVKVAIGPHMGRPVIYKIFRMIDKYRMKTLLVLEGDPWGLKDQLGYVNAYRDWLFSLLCEYQVPASVFGMQLGRHHSPIGRNLLETVHSQFIGTKLEGIHPINRHLVLTNPELPLMSSFSGQHDEGVAWAQSLQLKFFSEHVEFPTTGVKRNWVKRVGDLWQSFKDFQAFRLSLKNHSLLMSTLTFAPGLKKNEFQAFYEFCNRFFANSWKGCFLPMNQAKELLSKKTDK